MATSGDRNLAIDNLAAWCPWARTRTWILCIQVRADVAGRRTAPRDLLTGLSPTPKHTLDELPSLEGNLGTLPSHSGWGNSVNDRAAVRITGIIHTKNEEALVGQAIRSLAMLADEVIVADMHSADRTRALARAEGATVVTVPDFGYVEPALPIAQAHATGDWIMRLDADELLPPSLVPLLRSAAIDDRYDAVRIPRRNFMFGSEVRHAGWGREHDRHVRFYRNGSVDLTGLPIHNAPDVKAIRILDLPPDDETSLIHFNYLDWSGFLKKLNAYTSAEAKEYVARHSTPPRVRRSLYRAIEEAMWRLSRGRALADGMRGFTLVMLMFAYRLVVHVKIAQQMSVGDSDDVLRKYQEIALRAMET